MTDFAYFQVTSAIGIKLSGEKVARRRSRRLGIRWPSESTR
jgi:hypothetical protein